MDIDFFSFFKLTKVTEQFAGSDILFVRGKAKKGLLEAEPLDAFVKRAKIILCTFLEMNCQYMITIALADMVFLPGDTSFEALHSKIGPAFEWSNQCDGTGWQAWRGGSGSPTLCPISRLPLPFLDHSA